MGPSPSTEPAPPNTSSSDSESQLELETTPALLPVFIEAASGHPSPATYRLRTRRILISLQVISVSILIAISIVTLLGLSLALFATIGAIIMLLGNSILRSGDIHFTNDATAASIGAVGSLILCPPICVLYQMIPTSPRFPRYKYLHPILIVMVFPVFSVVIALIGSTVLLHYHVDLGGIDTSYASIAAAFAGTLLALPAMLFGFFIPSLVSSILSPIQLAIVMGVKWVHVKWTDKSHSYSYYGTRGDDPEINAELQNPPGRD